MSTKTVHAPIDIDLAAAALNYKESRPLELIEGLIGFMTGAQPIGSKIVAAANTLPDALDFATRGGGTELFRSDTTGDFAGYGLVFKGFGFTVDGDGNPTGGTVTDFEFYKGDKLLASFEFVAPATITDLLDAIESGSGTFSPANYADLIELLTPSFAFLIGTGSNGADTFFGSSGNDEIDAKKGNDVFFMFEGDDEVNGDAGVDTVDGRDVAAAMSIDLAKGSATHGSFTTDLISFENAYGSGFDDTIRGSNAANRIFGFGGNDTLFGKGGKDTFIFLPDAGTDTLKDFQDGLDKLDFRMFDFASKQAALAAFSEVGSKNDNKVEFSFEGTTIQITGADRIDISGADILI